MILAGNFKANHTRAATTEWLNSVSAHLATTPSPHEIMVFPPASALQPHHGPVILGAQNAYPADKGAYTGELCSEQLAEFQIATLLVGHSERRAVLKEPQEFIARKVDFFARQDFRIVYCVGEPIEVRQKGIAAVMTHVMKQFEGIDLGYAKLVVAYEPVWAIGTGMVASIEDIEEVHRELKAQMRCPILYGGSVNADNGAAILGSTLTDGVLVGGFSLKAGDFLKLVAIAQDL